MRIERWRSLTRLPVRTVAHPLILAARWPFRLRSPRSRGRTPTGMQFLQAARPDGLRADALRRQVRRTDRGVQGSAYDAESVR
jgi:hypothetical protein